MFSPARFLRRRLADPVTALAVSVFLTVVGLTLLIPVVPFLVGRYVPEPDVAVWSGGLLSVYAVCLFVAAPVLGAASDRFGRRPVLLVSLAGSIVGYLLTGIGGALAVLFAGRIIDGLTAGNISTVMAATADITPPAERGRVYGLLGATAGAGFMVGPALGGLFGTLSPEAPLFAAAAASALNLVWVARAVPETLPPARRTPALSAACLNPFGLLVRALRIAPVRQAFAPAFLFYLAGATMQATIVLVLKDVFDFGPLAVGALLALVGIMDIASQGVLVRLLAGRMAPRTLAATGLAVNAAGFAAIAIAATAASAPALFGAIVVFTLGDGLFQPAIGGLVANAAPDGEQGAVQGANQSQQSVARALGPLLGTTLYALDPALPYWTGAAIVLAGVVALAGRGRTRRREAREAAEAA